MVPQITDVQRMIRVLKISYFYTLFGVLFLYGLIEFWLLDTTGGTQHVSPQFEFIYQTVAILMTLFSCFGALRLFRLKKIKDLIRTDVMANYRKWSIVRIVILEVSALLNLIGYMLFGNPSFSYLFLIVILCFPFVYPSMGRFVDETGYVEE